MRFNNYISLILKTFLYYSQGIFTRNEKDRRQDAPLSRQTRSEWKLILQRNCFFSAKILKKYREDLLMSSH